MNVPVNSEADWSDRGSDTFITIHQYKSRLNARWNKNVNKKMLTLRSLIAEPVG